MNTVIPIHQAKTNLSQLVRRAAEGEIILIGAYGNATAKLVAVDQAEKPKKIFGAMKEEFEVPDDFDAPLPDDLLDAFEGRE